jgi:hypothetical protein
LERARLGGRPTEEEAGLADLAHLSLGRIHYSTAFRLGERGGAAIDARRLEAAKDSFARVRAWSELWQQSLFDQAWVYFMLGDHPRALGNVHSIEAPLFSNRYIPEADVLRATIVYSLCRYDEAAAAATRAWTRYKPVQGELEAILARQSNDGGSAGFYGWADTLDGRGLSGSVPASVRPALEQALSGRDLARHVDYVRSIEQEMARLRRAPASFRASRLGRDVADSLSLAHDLAVHQAGALAERRSRRALAELTRHLDDALRVLASARARGARPRPDRGGPMRSGITGSS